MNIYPSRKFDSHVTIRPSVRTAGNQCEMLKIGDLETECNKLNIKFFRFSIECFFIAELQSNYNKLTVKGLNPIVISKVG